MTTTDPQPLEKTYDNLVRIAADIAIEHRRCDIDPHFFMNLLRELDELQRYIDNPPNNPEPINLDLLAECISDHVSIHTRAAALQYQTCITNEK